MACRGSTPTSGVGAEKSNTDRKGESTSTEEPQRTGHGPVSCLEGGVIFVLRLLSSENKE